MRILFIILCWVHFLLINIILKIKNIFGYLLFSLSVLFIYLNFKQILCNLKSFKKCSWILMILMFPNENKIGYLFKLK